MANYSIGPFNFFSLSRPPGALSQRLIVEARSGADGVAIWDTGKRGIPFTTVSIVDVASIVAANQLYRQYLILKEPGDPIDVEWADYNPPASTKFAVLEVEQVPGGTRQTVKSVGGLFGLQAILTCAWTLIPVEV